VAFDDGVRRHGSDPFAMDPDDPVRRLRGRMVAPVTVWTATGPEGRRAGITVSSVMVVEGEPPEILGVLGPLTEFWEAVGVSRSFVVHVLGTDDMRVADQFAGRYPADPFDGLEVVDSDFGPVLAGIGTRAFCRLKESMEVGYFLVARGEIDETHHGDEQRPLVRYRGRYVTIEARH
jgi:3-hydroxy-9,10-secoandrosta-1,3,5(10)-triene-9,17-dione monooxygenase reductase component